MKKFIENLTNIWKIEELKNRIILTLGILLVYRFGAHIVLPGIDSAQLHELATKTSGGGLLDILNAFTGGAFSNASVFALGIMPYISASIVVQLMGIAIPYLQKLQKEGESGRRKINQITRWLTIAICIVQAPVYLYGINRLGVPDSAFLLGKGLNFIVPAVLILVTGTIFAMWLGEKITDKGIGNGISLLIMVGIIARLPRAFLSETASRLTGNGGPLLILIEIILWFVIILLCIYLIKAVRQIPVQYARRTAEGGTANERNIFGARQYIPLKLNAAGVMPIIFAQALMFIPLALVKYQSENASYVVQSLMDNRSLLYNIIYVTLIIAFTYFYTAITLNPTQMAEDMKRNNGFIPGIKPGKDTADYIDTVMSRLTLPGSLFIAFIAVMPALAGLLNVQQGFSQFFGGTSLLILVGVVIDTLQQIESYLMMRHYDGLLNSGHTRNAAGVPSAY